MRRILVAVAVLSFATVFQAKDQTPVPPNSATSIYSAAISQASLSGIKQFVIVRDTLPKTDFGFANPIIRESEFRKRTEEARSQGAKASRYDFCDSVPDVDYDSYIEALQDYLRENRKSIVLPSHLDLMESYRFISKDEALALTKDANASEESIFWVSAIGFSQDRTLALVYVETRGDSWGRDSGLYAFTKTQDGQWQHLQTFCHYRS